MKMLERLSLNVIIGVVLSFSVFNAFAQQAVSEGVTEAQGISGLDVLPKKKNKYRRSRLTRDEFQLKTDKRVIQVSAGEDRTVDLDFAIENVERDIKNANPQVVGVTPAIVGEEAKQIIFTGLKQGDTTVTVRDPSGKNGVIFIVSVTGSNLVKLRNEIRSLLKDVVGVDVKIVGQKVVLDGEVMVMSDYDRIYQVVTDKLYADRVLNLTTISPLLLLTIAKKIEEDVRTFAPNVKARPVNGMIFLEGSVDNLDQSKRAVEVAKLYLPEITLTSPLDIAKDAPVKKLSRSMIQNFILINPPPPKKQDKLVRITVHFVELSKGYNRLFGFRWAPGFVSEPQVSMGLNADGSGTSGSSFSATLSSLFPKLRSAQNAGYARILRTASVIVKSKERATFRSGKSIPFLIPASGTQPATVQMQNIDFRVDVYPTVVGQSDDIEIKINLNQSQAGGAGAQGAVETTNSEITTSLYVKSSESAAISNFSSMDVSTDFNKDPPGGNSRSPQGGEVFDLIRSKNYKKSRKQFVVFVTPQIIESAVEGSEEAKKNFRIRVK
jgi:pilus assembly protein CpaC